MALPSAMSSAVGDVLARYGKIVRAIADTGAAVFVQSTLMMAEDDDVNRQVGELDAGLRDLCARERCTFIDLNKQMAPDGRLRQDFTWDGLHLRSTAYQTWAKLIE